MQYKVIKSRPWIKDLQRTVDEWTGKEWELVSHSSDSSSAGFTFIFRKV